MKKSPRTAKPAGSKNGPETLKPSLRIRVADDLLAQIRALSKADRKAIGAAMNAAVTAWGRPHLHAGVGIRRLTKSIFECRVGLDERLAFVFYATPPELVFFFLGDHTAIQRLIRSTR